MRLTLEGRNEFIDRRAMDFRSDGGVKKSAPAASSASPSTASADGGAATSSAAADPDLAEKPPVETPEVVDPTLPAPVEGRPGAHGCGCYLAETSGSVGASLAISILGISLAIARRRRG